MRQPRLLLLDEATAALDTLTERGLQEALRPFLRRRTVIAVAHRLSTVLDADRIVSVHGVVMGARPFRGCEARGEAGQRLG